MGSTHSFNDIIGIENLYEAWKEFVRGKRGKKDVAEFGLNLGSEVYRLYTDLRTKTYRHGGYEAFKISDPKPRDIHKATVRDRLLHHAIYRILYPYFDTTFIHDSYSCRNGKGTHRALKQFETFARKVSQNYTKQCWVLKCDIRKFFANIDHTILLSILQKHIVDADILSLLTNVIESFNSGTKGKGLPLGNLTSQLFVNIYMNEFDQYVKHILKATYYIRYADDFVFLSRNRQELEETRQKCEAFLTERLSLTFHPDKVSIATLSSGVDFLGWVHFPKHRVLRTTTKRRMLKRVNENNLSSYMGLLSHGSAYKVQKELAG